MKKLAILGCGISAIPIIKKAREMGIKTYSFAMYELPITKGLADVFIPIAYEKVDDIVDKCMEIGIDGVMASSENTTEYTAQVAYKLGLPGNRIDGGFCGKDKYRMRKCLDNSDIVLQPAYSVYREDMPVTFPVIVKAVDSCGKKGISYVTNEIEMEQAVRYAHDSSTKSIILVEEYIESGTEYSVECLSSHNKHYIIQITKKEISGPPHFLEIGHHQPGVINKSHLQVIKQGIPEILTNIGIYNSMSHVEIKVTDDNKLYFIELGARAGGDHIADTLLGLSVDYDYYKGAIQIALDEFEEPIVNQKAYAGIYFYCKQTEYLKSLFEKAEISDWCVELKKPDDELQYATTNENRDKAGGYLIYRSDHKIRLGVDAEWMALRINDFINAHWLIWDFYRRTKRKIDGEQLSRGINKFIEKGNVFAILDEGIIVAMLNVYCNQKDSAYINNVEVFEPYRGKGLSKILMRSAICFCEKLNYPAIQLHVAPDNLIAESLYCSIGFIKTGKTTEMNGTVLNEFILNLEQQGNKI